MYCPLPSLCFAGALRNETVRERADDSERGWKERRERRRESGARWPVHAVKKADEEGEIMEWLSRKITVIYPVYEAGLRRAEKQAKNGEKIGR